MNREQISKQIRQQRQGILQQALADIQKDPNSDIDKDLRSLEHHDKLLMELASAGWRWHRLVAIAIAIISTVVAGLLAVCKTPSCSITLNLTAERVAITLKVALPALKSSMVMPRIKLADFSTIGLPYPHPPLASADADVKFEANGDKVILDELSIPESANIAVETLNGRPKLFIDKGSGRLLLSGKTSWRAVEEGAETGPIASEQDYEGSEAIDFSADGAVPATIEMFGREPLMLRNLAVSSLDFGRQVATDQPVSESTINTAKVSINEIGRETPLRQGDELRLDGVKGVIRTMKVDDRVHLVFEGTVKGIKAGPPHFLSNLKPNWLEYFYHQEKLGFIWSVIVFFWGFAWNFKKIIAK